ncbi:MAG: hypothetical protein QOD93_708 [Acetobacteraceae bacterium]|nr:hypothetical protein [Acetobacteraceae bacterium]
MSDGLRYAVCIRSEQHTGPAHLYRADADIEIVGDRLVCFPCNDSFENRTLAWAQRDHALGAPARIRHPVFRAPAKRAGDRGEKPVFVSRLLN